jgi:transposase-like protein
VVNVTATICREGKRFTFSVLISSCIVEGPAMLVHIQNLIDEAKCFETVRQLRWPDGVRCPHCDSKDIIKDGLDDSHSERQRYLCHGCRCRFDDLTGTIFAGHHQPLKTWILCLYLMGLNLSNQQIAEELDLNRGDVQDMTTGLRRGVVERRPEVTLSGEVECDEVYVVAGHKGHPEAVLKKGERADADG